MATLVLQWVATPNFSASAELDLGLGRNYMKRQKGLPPVASRTPKVLILGSFPSCESLLVKEYYANPRNQFWKIMSKVLGKSFDVPYARKIKILNDAGIALWDSVSSCIREGSSDSKIRNVAENDIEGFLRKNRSIRAIFYNGRAAEEHHRLGPIAESIPCEYLPSSSSAWALATHKKIDRWKRMKKHL